MRDMPMPPHIRDMLDATFSGVRRTFGGEPLDRERGIAAFRRRTEDVQRGVAARAGAGVRRVQGWGPLCAFLEVDVPDEPFPHHNLRADFWEALGGEPAPA